LCEISTDKVDTEIPSPGAGVIARLVAAEGQTLAVGALLAVIDAAGDAALAAGPQPAAPVTQAPPAPSPRASGGLTAAAAPLAPMVRPAAPAAGGPPRRYSPVVLRMAAEHGIDLSLIPGTGIGGRISKRDINRISKRCSRGQ